MKKTIALLTTSALFLFMVVVSHGADKSSIIPITEAIAIAIKHVPGDVVKAELERGLYEIKVRTAEGETVKIYLDAATGKPVEKATVSLSEATAIAKKEVPGEVIKVKFKQSKYEIKIRSTDGAIKEVYVDARSGNILKIKEKMGFLK